MLGRGSCGKGDVPCKRQTVLLVEDEFFVTNSKEYWQRQILHFLQHMLRIELTLIFLLMAVVVIPFGDTFRCLRNRRLTGHIYPQRPFAPSKQRRVLKTFKVCAVDKMLALWFSPSRHGFVCKQSSYHRVSRSDRGATEGGPIARSLLGESESMNAGRMFY